MLDVGLFPRVIFTRLGESSMMSTTTNGAWRHQIMLAHRRCDLTTNEQILVEIAG